MSQSDLQIQNAPGATVRADLNDNIEALATYHSGSTEPSVIFPYMVWADTANGLLKRRNPANTTWVTVGSFAGSQFVPYRDGVATGDAAARNVGTGAGANLLDRDQLDGRFLNETSNLSDLTSYATARTNLDVYSKAEVDSIGGSVDTADIVNGAVTNPKVANSALGSEKFQTGATEANWVRSRISSSGINQVGTYAFLIYEFIGSVLPGDTFAGSDAYYSNTIGQKLDGRPSGTWRVMGGRISDDRATLCLRIS